MVSNYHMDVRFLWPGKQGLHLREYCSILFSVALIANYVADFKYHHQRTGTLWEGRFKACLVNASEYLLNLYRDIELNPVRANMVGNPADYGWSSYQCNALDRKSPLLTPHDPYLALDYNPIVYPELYRSLFINQVEGALLEDIRHATNKGLILGSESFVAKLEALCGRRLREGLKGRPRKNVH